MAFGLVSGAVAVVVAPDDPTFDLAEPPLGVDLEVERADVGDEAATTTATPGAPEWILSGRAKPRDLERLTTPTRKVVANPDGTETVELSAGPRRVKRDGKWVELDPSVVVAGDRSLRAEVGLRDVRIASRADGGRARVKPREGDLPPTRPPADAEPLPPVTPEDLASTHGRFSPHFGRPTQPRDPDPEPLVVIPTDAGEVELVQLGASGVPAQVVGDEVTFVDALSEERDVVLSMLPAGVKQSVVLDDASAPSFYDVLLRLPPGVDARMKSGAVVFVDDGGDVVGGFGGGLAWDSAARTETTGPAQVPVTISLEGSTRGEVRVRVAVDEAWVEDPARVFPVTIDPTLGAYSNSAGFAGDTFTQSTAPNTSFWGDASVYAGSSVYILLHTFRSYFWFHPFNELADLRNWAESGYLALMQIEAGSCGSSPLFAYALANFGAWTITWNNAPSWYEPFLGGGWLGCAQGWSIIDIGAMSQEWMNSRDYGYSGVELLGGWEANPYSWHRWLSGDTAWTPLMSITYTRHDAQYTSTRTAPTWNRVEGQASQIPVTVTNTGSGTWPANGNDVVLSCWIDKPDGTFVGNCPDTKFPTAVGPNQAITLNANFPALPALAAGDYQVRWDLRRNNVPIWYSQRGVAKSAVEPVNVKSVNPHARGDNPYVEFAGGVNTGIGSYFYETTDAAPETIGPALTVSRAYNHRDTRNGWFGRGWSSSYEIAANADANGDYLVRYPDGRLESYAKNTNGTYAAPTGFYSTFVKNADGTTRLVDKDQTTYEFAGPANNGRLTKITDANGRSVLLAYSGGELVTATDQASARTLTYTWTGGHVTEVRTDPVARNGEPAAPLVWKYSYVGDKLTRACDPLHGTGPNPQCEEFSYDAYDPPRITRVTRPLGNTAITITYTAGNDDRVATTTNGAGNTTAYAYAASTGCNGTAKQQTTVTDARGATRVLLYNEARQLVCRTDEENKTETFVYDGTTGFLAKQVEANLITTQLFYEGAAGTRGNMTRKIDGTGATSYYTYNSQDQLIEERDGRSSSAADNTYLTTHAYDATGVNRVSTTPPSVPGAPLGATSYTYTTGASTTGSFDGIAIPPKGLVVTEQEPGQNPTRSFYDAAGDLRRREDPQGLVTEYDYDTLGVATLETRRWVNADQTQSSAPTATVSDALGRPVRVTQPSVTNPVTGHVHQRQIVTAYDANRNRTQVRELDVGGSPAPDPERQTTYEYDLADREFKVNYSPQTDPTGGSMTRTFDANGNVATVTDQLGRVTETTYSATNRPTLVKLLDANADAQPALGQALTMSRFAYDAAGRKASEFDALNRERRFTYDGEDRPVTTTLYTPAGGLVATLEEHAYDAAGNETTTKTGNGTRTTATTYFPNSLVNRTTLDPAGLNRVTDTTYDTGGRPTTVRRSIGGAGTTEETRSAYDPASGLKTGDIVENGAIDLVTSYGYDTRGLTVSTTDPNGATTTAAYDELDRTTHTILPPIAIDAADPLQPTTITGYNTFGETTDTQDPNGNLTRRVYDTLARRTEIHHPSYTPPDGSPALSPVETYEYDLVGNTTASTDRRGQTSTYAFDLLNRVRTKTEPAVAGGQPVTIYAYDPAGNPTQVVDPNGIVTIQGFDPRNRTTSSTIAGLTTTYGYDDRNNQTSIAPPGQPPTLSGYNPANERTSVQEPGASPTTTAFDLAGRPLVVTDPVGRTTTNTYDLAGRQLTETRAGDGTTVQTSFGYDNNGNQTSVTTPRGYTSTSTYDAANRLSTLSIPIAEGQAIGATYGYDRVGNVTRIIDGKTNTTAITYNPWNLPERRTEPPTPGQEDPASREFVASYDAGGLLTTELQPGGVTVTRGYDAAARLTTKAGSGGGAPAAEVSYGYDLAGRRTNTATPTTSYSFGYDDRGLLTSANGTGGNSSFGYDNAGRMTQRSDAAGTATFTWDNRNNLATEADPLTSVTRTHTWNDANQLTQVDYSTGPVRALDYDGLGRLTEDALSVNAQPVYGTTYGYDEDSNLRTQTITGPSGTAGLGTHTFDVDYAGRLTAWTPPAGPAIPYEYDAAGNRTRDGDTTYTYDARNRLTAASNASTWAWNSRGTLDAETTPEGTVDYTYDALGRLIAAGNVSYTYDALDRIATRDTATFSYAGTEIDPVADGTWLYAHSPSGDVLALDDPLTPDPASLAGQNRHGDLVTLFQPDGTLTDTTSYTPYGEVADDQGTLDPQIGFQSDWTDPETNDVWMGARWYGPDIATFLSRDDIPDLLHTPITLNRYTYATDDPLDYFDPDGHLQRGAPGSCDAVCRYLRAIDPNRCAACGAVGVRFYSPGGPAAEQRAVAKYLQIAAFLGCAPGYNCPIRVPRGLRGGAIGGNATAGPKPQSAPKIAPGGGRVSVTTASSGIGATRKPGKSGNGGSSGQAGKELKWTWRPGGYSFDFKIGNWPRGEHRALMRDMQLHPNRYFPFHVQGGPIALGQRLRLGREQDRGGFLGAVRVSKASNTSFTFYARPGHIEGDGGRITFSVQQRPNGDSILQIAARLGIFPEGGRSRPADVVRNLGARDLWSGMVANIVLLGQGCLGASGQRLC